MRDSSQRAATGKREYRVRRLQRFLRLIIGPRNKNTTFQTHADRYYSHAYLSKDVSEVVAFLAKANRMPKMAVVDQAVRAGLGRILGNAIREENRRQAAASAQGLPAKSAGLVRELVRWAKRKGYDASEFF